MTYQHVWRSLRTAAQADYTRFMNAFALQLWVFTVAGWSNRGQQQVIEYLWKRAGFCASSLVVGGSVSLTLNAGGLRCGPDLWVVGR